MNRCFPTAWSTNFLSHVYLTHITITSQSRVLTCFDMVWILHGNARITEVGSGALMHVDVRHCLRSQSSWCSCVHIARHAPSEVIYFSKHQVSGSPNIQQLQMGACAALSTRFGSPLLCSQVGGRLRCLGSNQRLKARFGQGYQLEVWEIARSWLSLMSLCHVEWCEFICQIWMWQVCLNGPEDLKGFILKHKQLAGFFFEVFWTLKISLVPTCWVIGIQYRFSGCFGHEETGPKCLSKEVDGIGRSWYCFQLTCNFIGLTLTQSM